MLKEKPKGEMDNIPLKSILKPADLLLMVSPVRGITMISLGVHLLQARCREAGIKTGVLYPNLPYSKCIGAELHESISIDQYFFMGERIFSTAAFGCSSVSIGEAMHKFSGPNWAPDHIWPVNQQIKNPRVPEPVVPVREWLDSVDPEYLESLTTGWLHRLARQIVDIGFGIVGCSTTLGGLAAPVALLNCIKKANPRVITILGGSLCEAEMAEGILSLNTGIDYIFSGEGEITLPTLVKNLLNGRLPKEKIIYGQKVIDLDTNPFPDFQAYVEQIETFHPNRSSGEKKYALPFETSRGCWYGKCTFCGLNGKQDVFRCKSPGVVIQHLKTLVEQYDMNMIVMTDNMMPHQYFDTLIPRLSTEIPSTGIFYNMSARLTLDQAISLKKAGITEFQPGIESLSISLLRRMHKLHTVRDRIALLRYARSVGVKPMWNLLFGFPGDQTSEYEEMLHLFPLLRHLQPPTNMGPLGLCRFSQYQTSPGSFGISDLRPAQCHRDTLPSHAHLDKIAYYFTADFWSQSRENPAVINALWRECQAWQKAWAPYEMIPLDILLPTLHVTRKANALYILEDTRGLSDRPKRVEIDREQASLLLVARPRDKSPDINRAVNAGLGIIMESWFIPLATAEPALLQEFEREYEETG